MGIGAYGLADKKTAKTLYVVGWADEEGVAFGKSCLGSSAVSGIVTSKDVLPLIHQKNGRSFSDVWQEYGLNANRIGEAHTAFAKLPVKAYLELHIEQAPLLALAKKKRSLRLRRLRLQPPVHHLPRSAGTLRFAGCPASGCLYCGSADHP